MKRYSIMVLPQHWPKSLELCQVESDPEEIVKGAKKRLLPDGTPRYSRVWIEDRGEKNERELPQGIISLTPSAE